MGLDRQGHRWRVLATIVATIGGAALLSACSASQSPVKALEGTKSSQTTEHFAESEWGVSASPRVAARTADMRRGGGRDHIGQPYQIRGQWYHPKEQPGYRNVGLASWYGDAFHGRLTANGEVYDMTHLTAAHPTMPLPSYARVTNVETGASLVVRVNDRGPFVRGRIIDLSRRSAELLGTKGRGLGRVEVEYLGRAPLHGQDEQFLMASYRPSGAPADPSSDGLPGGVMMAMQQNAPSVAASSSTRARVSAPSSPSSGSASEPSADRFGGSMPAFSGFSIRSRPAAPVGRNGTLSYSGERVHSAAAAFDLLSGMGGAEGEAISGPHIAVGTFDDAVAISALAERLSTMARVFVEPAGEGLVSILAAPDGRATLDEVLSAAWAAGALDAMTVRE